MDLPRLRTLFFEDLPAGMTETLEKKGLILEKSRALLSRLCAVGGAAVLDGEALVKVPSQKAAKGKRPMIRL